MVSLPRRRSCLTVPGASEKMLAKALTLPADEIVFDLEDAVPVADKANARKRVAALLATDAWRDRTVSVRINAVGTTWCSDDIAAMAAAKHPRLTLVVPKVEHVENLTTVESLVAAVEAKPGGVGLQALIETAAGVANVRAVAGATPRLQALIIGYADLASSLGRPAESQASWQTVQDLVLIAARANGLQAIDGAYFQIKADDALLKESERARAQGFEGKWVIHPSHIETVNAAFTPSDEEVEDARSLMAHLDAEQGLGMGASTFRGRMVDEAMRLGALRTLARAGLEE